MMQRKKILNALHGQPKKLSIKEIDASAGLVGGIVLVAILVTLPVFITTSYILERNDNDESKSHHEIQGRNLLAETSENTAPSPTSLPSHSMPQELPSNSSRYEPPKPPASITKPPVIFTKGSVVYLNNEQSFTDDEGVIQLTSGTKLTVVEVLGKNELRVQYQPNPYRNRILTITRDDVNYGCPVE